MKTFLLLAFAFSAAAVRAEDPVVSRASLSHPDQPARVRIHVMQGDLRIVGVDANDAVTVRTDAVAAPTAAREDGLRVISSAASFSLTEKENVVDLQYGDGAMPGGGADFEVTVPKTASIEISNSWSADVHVENIAGDVEIRNMSGEIVLDRISGGALVETMNGEIKATFTSVAAKKPLSFTSMNGRIEVRVPAETQANVRFRTQNGSILTDFPEDALKTKTESVAANARRHSEAARAAGEAARKAAQFAREVAEEVRDAIREETDDAPAAPRAPGAPRPPGIPGIVGGKVVSGTLNGGGTEIQAATMNGDIVVRRIK